jgi:lysophospholipase L1-like esterase
VRTSRDAVRVLCFGASDTYGTCLGDSRSDGTPTPDPDYVRLHADRRWPGALQRLLGEGYDVLEEGLNGRTTDLDDPHRPGLNGRSYFVPCLLSHRPLDVVVVMLGGNDLKPSYDRTPAEIAHALAGYVDDVRAHVTGRDGSPPRTILVGPVSINDTAPKYRDLLGDNVDPAIPARSRELADEVRRVAEECGVDYADAAQVAWPGDDGMHLSIASHRPVAELLAAMISGRP